MSQKDLKRVLYIEGISYNNPWDAETIGDLLAHDDVRSRVAVVSGKVEGYNIYSISNTHFQLINLTVSPAMLRNKIATNLIADMFKADPINIRTRNIDAWVNELKLPMLLFLKNNGFKSIGLARNLFGTEDGILMRLSITDDYSIPDEYEKLLEDVEYISFKSK
jgi:hypothetical protein